MEQYYYSHELCRSEHTKVLSLASYYQCYSYYTVVLY